MEINPKERVEELINTNKRFVETMAERYLDKGLTKEELTKAGMAGLTEAAQKFDPSCGFKFISFAVWYIRQSILAVLESSGNEDGKLLCKEAEAKETKNRELDLMLRSGKVSDRVMKAIEELSLRDQKILLFSYGFGYEPCTDEEICAKLDLTQPRLIQNRCRILIKLRKRCYDDVNSRY